MKLQWRLRYIERNLFCATAFWLIPGLSLWPVQCTWYSARRFFTIFCLLNGWRSDSYFASQTANELGAFIFSPFIKLKTVVDTCSICTCPGDEGCAFQLVLLPGGCCLTSGVEKVLVWKFDIWGKTVSALLQHPVKKWKCGLNHWLWSCWGWRRICMGFLKWECAVINNFLV